MSNRQFSTPDPQQEPVDDSMQLKRDRLGVDDSVAESQVDEKRLHYVDRLLKSAPMVSAPRGFAERVMNRLKGSTPHSPDYEQGTGIVVGLGAGSLVYLPLLATAVYILVRSILDSAFRSRVWDIAGNIVAWIVAIPTDYPFIFAAVIIAVVIALIMSGYLVWFWRGLIRSTRHWR
jgi:hypothetical protein